MCDDTLSCFASAYNPAKFEESCAKTITNIGESLLQNFGRGVGNRPNVFRGTSGSYIKLEEGKKIT
jgi:hypothetical protein